MEQVGNIWANWENENWIFTMQFLREHIFLIIQYNLMKFSVSTDKMLI